MVKDVEFIEDDKGNISLSPNICIKLVDFGVAQMFMSPKIHRKDKGGLLTENGEYLSPKQLRARSADIKSLGLILFECMTSIKLYHGFLDLHCSKIKHDVKKKHNVRKYFNRNSMSLLNQLLSVDQDKKISGITILRHPWFKMYFGKYGSVVMKKLNFDRNRYKICRNASVYV